MITATAIRRPRAWHLASVVAALTMTLLLTGPASAAIPAGPAAPAGPRTIPTLFDPVRVFATPSTHANVKARLTDTGTAVQVACWTSGAEYHNLAIWYQVTGPVAGYVAAFNLAAHFSPAAGVPHCRAPAFSAVYYSLERDLHIRTGPSINSAISGALGSIGSRVTITCYTDGSPIYGDSIWYHAQSPATGYVSGRLLNTGGDPAPGIPHC